MMSQKGTWELTGEKMIRRRALQNASKHTGQLALLAKYLPRDVESALQRAKKACSGLEKAHLKSMNRSLR